MEYDPVQIENVDESPARNSLRRPVVIAGFLLGVAALGMGAVVVMPHVAPGAPATFDESDRDSMNMLFFGRGPPAPRPNPHPHIGPKARKCKGGKKLKLSSYTGQGCPAGKTIKVCFNNNKYSLGGRYGGPGRDKLQNGANFGPGGKVKYPVSVIQMNPPITKAALDANGCDIFQIGLSEGGAGGALYRDISASDVAALKQWSDGSPHHVVFGFQSYAHAFENHYDMCKNGATNPMTPTSLGKAILDHGAFGDVGNFNQGGSWKGVLGKLDPQSCVLIKDAKNWPIAVLDLSMGSVFMSDVDIITQLGGLSNGGGISSQNDWVFGNMYGFLIGIVCNGPPAGCDFGPPHMMVKICDYKPGPRPPSRRRRTRRRRSIRRRRTRRPAPKPKPCCKALTAKCLGCRLGMTTKEFCGLAPCMQGCPVKPLPPPPPPPCDPTKPTWFCKRDPISYSHYPTCNEVNYGVLCCIPNKAFLSGSKYQYSNCGKSRCKANGAGVVPNSKCPKPEPAKRKCYDEAVCIAEAKERAKHHTGNVVCTGSMCDKKK